MTWEVTVRPCWHGGCVRRIRAAAAALALAARRNLVIIGREDCDAALYGFPRGRMAEDFRARAFTLADELLFSGKHAPGSSSPAEYPATTDLPVEVRDALDRLGNVFSRQMSLWGWGVEDEPNEAPRLIYRISKSDLAKLRQSVKRLDEALALHAPQPIDTSEGEASAKDANKQRYGTWKPLGTKSSPQRSEPCRGIEKVYQMDGTEGLVDLGRSTKWVGEPKVNLKLRTGYYNSLYRTRGGRWILGREFSDIFKLFNGSDKTPPPDELFEVTLDRAARWFIEDWQPPRPVLIESMPPEVAEWIARLDVDQREREPSQDTAGQPAKEAAEGV